MMKRKAQEKSAANDNIKNMIIGFFAGLASLMPGISGGTILVITQKYDRLLKAANNMMKFKFYKEDVSFFLWVMSGALLAVIFLTRIMAELLKNHADIMTVLFVGLILGGAWILANETNLKKPVNFLLALTSFLLTAPVFEYLSQNVVNQSASFSLWYLILGGAFAAFCWVLPGISGSASLVMLGLYKPVMVALSTLDFALLIPVGAGAVLGGIICVKLLAALFERYRHQGMAMLLGLTLGGVWGLLGFAITFNTVSIMALGILISLTIEKVLS